MIEIDLRNAVLYDPDAEHESDIGCEDIIPPEAYGRRIRVIHTDNETGVKVKRVRMNVPTVRRFAGFELTVTPGVAISGQDCIMLTGSEGRLFFGKGCTSITRKTVRMMRVSIMANGKLRVVV